ncbi:MAG: 2OG-Fe(II) oxygenase [Hydrogenophaga sp.]|uniref:2OG-Fe(II) oxygenase n=1 Tax=Hydrogenophaga sp. TaxID=1904254 RepID=UPI0016B014E4|nr:2OG-Fe(II) oxygenase [Hydrogenophaga sp.]NIM40167.1 2OG-Fe(II) oxygenase [Hydrogenophaga sp.]NIN25401.1 2OG-Fe(II) oxygenase [Hydrogenophaga sp.]NIN32258.1 2OG-Fe(II) oxygenase [Hydrogenophaga sp.]NIN56507.1 2OG-Fe(II) oxygenase [Hydrogenophaga sp.]NIO52816.1 2OG-Fe(II) oxygenase [Hydrogenophaga sp.]
MGDVGEHNHLDVGRFMEDKKEQTPVFRNDPLGREVIERLNQGRCRELLSALMEGEFYIRRCQANVLREGGFIGKHIDTHSNLDYRYSCVIQFGEAYEGGEFFIEHEGREHQIRTGYADFLINRCEIPHGVRTVRGGSRTSLVFFLSKSPLSQPNHHHKQI